MSIKQKKKKRKTRILGKLISMVCLVVAIVFFVRIGKELINHLELKNEQAEISEQLSRLEEENKELLETKTKLEDPNYITTYASGEYMFSKGDEKLFRLPSKN